jgi:hypothetical protein
MINKDKFLSLIAFTVAIVVVVVGINSVRNNVVGQSFVPLDYSTASSTQYTAGDDISVEILQSKSNRVYAEICNNTWGNTAYLEFGSTVITATSSADRPLLADNCYVINETNLYTGMIQVITDGTASTTRTISVVELRK